MKLWLFDCSAPEDDIEAGCAAAAALIEKRGLSVKQAYDAVMKRSNRERFERRAAQAPALVPQRVYKPPMITAPDHPAKIAPVRAKKSRMAWLCL